MTSSLSQFFNADLADTDPALAQAIDKELTRQRDEIELIASENIVSKAVMQAQGSVMTNKYAEGYVGRRYYGGCEYVDIAETLAMRIGKLISNPSGAMADGGDPIKKVQIDLVNFNQAQRTQFIDLMVNEFPGFLKIVNMQHAGPHTRFAYYSEAPNIKLQKWIDISLRDIGINPETGADVLVKPGTIQIVLTATGSSRGNTGNPLKYN